MTEIIALLARWGVPESVRKPIGYLVAAVVLIVLCGLLWAFWLHSHDRKVIARHEAPIAAAVASATAAAQATADANDMRRQAANATSAAVTERAIADAEASHPAEVRAPAGPAARAATDSLRARAAAARAAAR